MNIQWSVSSLKNTKIHKSRIRHTSIQEANPINHIFITVLNILTLCLGIASRQLFLKEWS